MLGIDINDNFIRVVHLIRHGGNFVLQDTLEVSLTEEQASDPIILGQMLSAAISENHWQDQKAVMTIPARFGFIRYFPADMVPADSGMKTGELSKNQVEELLDRVRQSMMTATDQLIFDLWITTKPLSATTHAASDHKYGVLVGAAQADAVRFCRDFASAANLKLKSLELRSLAAINGLLLHWHEAKEENIAVAYFELDRGDIAIIEPEGILSLPSVNISADVSPGGPIFNLEDLVRQLRRIFNTAKLSDARSAPQRLFIAGAFQPGILEDLAVHLRRELELEVTSCTSWRSVMQLTEPEPDLSCYVPALGAALDGLEVSPSWFNFLLPRSARPEKPKPITWRPFALIGIITILMFTAFWFYLVQQKRATLQDLGDAITQADPDLNSTSLSRDNWNLFRSFVSTTESGIRMEYLRIVGEISRLFPDTESAYATRLEITVTESGNEQITVTGWVREAAILTDFTNNLNVSTMFRDVGTSVLERKISTPNHPYPFNFIVNFNLRRSVDEVKYN